MIKLSVNNGRTMELTQDTTDSKINVVTVNSDTKDNEYDISSGDMVMLLNYYRYVKINNVQCDFINPNGNK